MKITTIPGGASAYVAPACREVLATLRNSVLAGSYGPNGAPGGYNSDDDDDDYGTF